MVGRNLASGGAVHDGFFYLSSLYHSLERGRETTQHRDMTVGKVFLFWIQCVKIEMGEKGTFQTSRSACVQCTQSSFILLFR